MRVIWKYLKWILISLGFLIALIIIATAIFMNTAPQFGKKPNGNDLERISSSKHFSNGKFINLSPTAMGSFGEMIRTIPEFINGKNLKPKSPIETSFTPFKFEQDSSAMVTWYGHSAFKIRWQGKTILIDPMFGPVASPVSFGSKRFRYTNPIELETFDHIDAIIISHDHYDHLDYHSIMKLKDQTEHFYAPLGVGSHLKYWGVPEDRITELDWWQSAQLDDIQLIAAPSRHFSGRGIADRNSTQWASWVLIGNKQKVYFSGDGGYGPHFKEIGEKYGPFDLAMMECGQYNQAWQDIHMMPEESVQAGIDVGGKILMPIHWGAFNLAIHSWTDPIERFSRTAKEKNIKMIHPEIGQNFTLGEDIFSREWWKQD
jgi:L-ascorbate metabolism protein UlaG (beta-lactamase superfamily)